MPNQLLTLHRQQAPDDKRSDWEVLSGYMSDYGPAKLA